MLILHLNIDSMHYAAVGQSNTIGILKDNVPAALFAVIGNMALVDIVEYSLVKIAYIIVVGLITLTETDKNTPPISEVKRLAEVFYLPTTTLIDDTVETPEFSLLESLAADEFWPRPATLDSTPHKVYDAGLIKNANLHRFLNKAGAPYSAIYVGRNEMLSCERDHEQGMIDYWNQG